MDSAYWQQVWGEALAYSILEIIAVVTAIFYVIFAARQHMACWPFALVSSGIYLYLVYEANLYLESYLQGFYILMAIVGWWSWRRAPKNTQGAVRPVTKMDGKAHLFTLLLGLAFTFGMGAFFSATTDASMPYIDSFTTGFALITTYWVTQKKLENWLYWVAIDAVSIYLYFAKGFYLTSLLFIAYTIIALVGYFQWRGKMQPSQTVVA